ncbi:MAG: hypothetical protein C4555_04355 [Dehalococcoidia bacterium]|nr:MAG: hypothetical protein C4555_04355 [Dehalococcoidia bacterium]
MNPRDPRLINEIAQGLPEDGEENFADPNDLEIAEADDGDGGQGDVGPDEGHEEERQEDGDDGGEVLAAEPQDEPPPQRRPNPASKRVQEAVNAAREARLRADALERQIAEMREAERQRQAQFEQQNEEQLLARMTPEQRVDYKLRRAQEQQAQLLYHMQQQQLVEQDRLSFQSIAAAEPKRRQYVDKVEELFRQQITNPPSHVNRDTIYKYLRGAEIVEAERAAAVQKKPVPSARAQRETVAAPNPRGAARPGGAKAPRNLRELPLAERERLIDEAVRAGRVRT